MVGGICETGAGNEREGVTDHESGESEEDDVTGIGREVSQR